MKKQEKRKNQAPIYDLRILFICSRYWWWLTKFLIDKNKINERVFTFPTSAIKENGIKINYYNYLTQTNNPDCLKSLEKITKKLK